MSGCKVVVFHHKHHKKLGIESTTTYPSLLNIMLLRRNDSISHIQFQVGCSCTYGHIDHMGARRHHIWHTLPGSVIATKSCQPSTCSTSNPRAGMQLSPWNLHNLGRNCFV